jgi:hypothetical protein
LHGGQLTRYYRVAREIISKRFGEGAEVRQDMIGSFIKNGLSLQECADESLIQMYASLKAGITV